MHPSQVAWLSLDKSDDNPARFWAYFVAALRTVHAGIGKTGPIAGPSLDVVNVSPPLETILANLINEIAAISAPIVLILDDFHVITDRQINDGVAFLLDHMPPQMRLVISSRADPSWPLARLRARGEMTELRVDDLRFTPAQAAAFLNHAMELELVPQDVAALEQRTEGWIAGLQMAAISMQGHRRARGVRDVSGFVAAFTGSNRFILDYLVEEVLDQQSPAIQEFLLQTCILDRLTGPLCDAIVRDPHDAQLPIADLHGQGTLEYLERINLFVVPLDDHRQWYRYHRLFADLLHSRLKQAYPGQLPALHRRASAWYEENGLLADAVSHALAAGDVERMARLVEGNVFAIMDHGELASLAGWLDALTEKVVRSRPWLCVFHAWVLVHTAQLDAVEARLVDAERAMSALGQSGQSDERRIAGHIAAELDFRHEPGYLTLVRVLIAQAERRPGGSLDRASSLLTRLLQTTEAAGRMGRVIEILTLQALTLQAQAKMEQALIRLERALAIAEPQGHVYIFVDGGEPMRKLLWQAIAQGSGDYARKLLAAFDPLLDEDMRVLADPLSERELQVLRLLTTSLSTPEIAAELVVAASTVRSHVKSIYRKLNVRRRIDAIRRAEELKLL